MKKYLEMLQWKRPQSNDLSTKFFAQTYLEPVFGKPDEFGNYIYVVNNGDGSAPNLCFTAHYDTVHSEGGFQELLVEDDVVTAVNSDCLGADCTTGIWLILEMIDSFVPGTYIIHADEESGCLGSGDLVKSSPAWFGHTDAVISFDRYGTTSVVTHQMRTRTASDAFAHSLADALNMPELKPDDNGVYTDSNEYRGVISECTNVSVGYYGQHTERESQDLIFLEYLRDSLISADWSKLVFERNPEEEEFDWYYGGSSGGNNRFAWMYDDREAHYRFQERQLLFELICDHPEELAEYLQEQNILAEELAQEMGVPTQKYYLDDNQRIA